ncbi:MAG: CZB domain-containing protein [Gammaproteobacteria bacterium]|nr:CZB domain-containing protein [Gammaproteobacteria bacterium]
MALKHEIDQAIADHAAWKARFRDFINGKIELDAATVGKENLCQFGQWIEKEGERMLLPKEVHDEIFSLHAEFHRVAGTVVDKKNKGDIQGAQQDLATNGAFGKASNALMQRMLKIKT